LSNFPHGLKRTERHRWSGERHVVNDVGSTKGDIAKYAEVIRYKIKTVGAIENDGAPIAVKSRLAKM
jgi:hypothetical protein